MTQATIARSAWDEARGIAWSHRRRLALGLLLILVNRLAGLVLPASTKWLIDDVVAKGHWELVGTLAFAVAAAGVLQAAATFSLSQLLGTAAHRAIVDLRKALHAHVMRLPIGYFNATPTGTLISRVMNDAEGVRNLVGGGFVELIGSLVTSALSLAVLLYLDWRLTAVVLVVVGVLASGMATVIRRLRPLFRERGRLTAEVTGRLAESLGGIRTVRAYRAEQREGLVFAAGVQRIFRNVVQVFTAVAGVSVFSTLILTAVGVVMLVVGGASIRSGRMTVGDLVMYMTFVALMVNPVIQVSSIGSQLFEAVAGLDRVGELRQLTTEDEEDEGHERLPNLRGDVEFVDVSFEYTAGVPVLEHISFRTPAGTTTALVGPSGAGKSTLIDLIMGFSRPSSGQVIVDGRDLASLRRHDFRAHLGIVMQDNFLFDGTIADNIAYANPSATRHEIVAASRIAHCDEFISRFEQGYDTIVGERGVRLSCGQRQRVAIARAIMADPGILILDEATSSLDSESEAFIQDGLKALRRGRTTFVIAHRLSTIRSADQILVLERGRIVERGTHEMLMRAAGRYSHLYSRQFLFEQAVETPC